MLIRMRITRFIVLIFIGLIFIGCNSPTKKSVPRIKYHDYYIPIQGGGIKMKLDSITPLNELIPQLRTNHKLYETYKGYWIGYNDLMFSIAVHGDSAIDPLLTFIDTTNTIEAKYVGILTLI